MDRIISILISITLTCLLALYSGCSGGAATDNLDDIIGSPTPSPSPTPGPSPSPTPSPSPSTGADDTFYITTSGSVSDASYVHLSTSFSTPCSIASSATSSQDIVCYVNMPEADVTKRDLPLVYHVPPGMCRYLSRQTFWFYNEEVGIGPTSLNFSVSKTVTEDASGTQTVSYLTDFDCTVNGNRDDGCNDQVEIYARVKTDGTILHGCIYDQSESTDEDRHNCCLGDYTYNVTTITELTQPSGTTITSATSTTENKSWGGSVGECIGGAGRSSWTSHDEDGYPTGIFEEAENGVTQTYTIKNPNAVQKLVTTARSLHTANYYDVAGVSTDHTHTGYVASATTSVKPYYLDPIDDRDGTAITEGNDAYTFICMDEGYEAIHRIKVYVREFDTRADYDQYISSSGVIYNPDLRGLSAPASCIGLFGPCNDYYDSDDFLSWILNRASYDTVTVSDRDLNFPYLKYND